VVSGYANSITRTERDDKTGEDVEHEIPYMKGYTVFNVEEIDGLPEVHYAKAAATLDPVTLRRRLRLSQTLSFQRTTSASINPLPQGIHFAILFALYVPFSAELICGCGARCDADALTYLLEIKTVRPPQCFVSGILGTEK
jgi:hypothetical protein